MIRFRVKVKPPSILYFLDFIMREHQSEYLWKMCVLQTQAYARMQGCGLVLEGQAVRALGGIWHPQCLKCAHCNTPLTVLAEK